MIDLSKRKAIVLAAGLGKRMRPLTDHMPKPLVPVAGTPLIDHTLDFIASSGIEEVVVNTHYMAELLEQHLQGRIRPRVLISREDTLLETGGGIVKALPMLGGEAFFAINSDTICVNGEGHALQRLAQQWNDEEMDALLLLHPVAGAVGYEGEGDFSLEANGTLVRRVAGTAAPYVFTGVQILHPRLFAHAPQGAFSLNILYNQAMQGRGALPRIRALVHNGKWLHVGDPAAIALAEAALSS